MPEAFHSKLLHGCPKYPLPHNKTNIGSKLELTQLKTSRDLLES
jgi:hypothetical protein